MENYTLVETNSDVFKCPRCSRTSAPQAKGKPICTECVALENSKNRKEVAENKDWIAAAKECGIPLWELQPHENETEYRVWQSYRDLYPGQKPTFAEASRRSGVAYSHVKSIAGKWNFQIRMQAWIAHMDSKFRAQKEKEMIEMQESYSEISRVGREKVAQAMQNISPYEMSVKDLVSLLKTVNEIEEKALLKTGDAQATLADMSKGDADNANLKKVDHSQKDMAEIINVLSAAGVLDDKSKIGIKKTETTEVVVVDDGGN